jgi:exodeoxyribonuclease III
MRIITWNCNMAFRNKAEAVLKYKPDILVIQECEHPDKLKFGSEIPKPLDSIWIGANKNKGLGLFSYSTFRFKLHKSYNEELKLIAPVKVFNEATSLQLYAIWANNPQDKDGPYVTQVWKSLKYYGRMIRRKGTILVGDFNSNTIWDRPRREGNHSTVVKKLREKAIQSVYHKYFNQEQGKEVHPTHYLYRHRDKPYHLDYCFVSDDLMGKLQLVEVGDYDAWKSYSDHVPLIVTFG